MSNLLKSKFLLGVMTLAIMFVGVVASNATPASAACSITTTLRQGSTGAEVQCLQTALGGLTADGNFGPMTKAAVMAFQSNEGLTPDGVFGAMSRAAWMNNQGNSGAFPAGCTSASGFSSTTGMSCAGGGVSNLPAGCSTTSGFSPTTGMACSVTTNLPAGCSSASGFSPTTGASCAGGTTNTGPLAGTFGTISAITQVSSYSNEEVGSGQKDVKVMGWDVETSKDGDIQLNSIKLTFDSTGNDSGDSDRFVDYVDTVTVWQGSTKIGTSSADDFTKESTGVYSRTIALTDSIIRADKKERFYVSIDVVNNLDSGDIAGSTEWSVGINNIRYSDGAGVVTTDTDTTPAAIEYNAAGEGVNIEFVSFSSAADTELKINVDSTLKAGVRTVNTTSATNDVLLLKGTFKLEGTSNVWLDEVPFLFTTNATNVDAVTPTVYFTIDGTEFSESMTSSAGTTEVITFNDLDKTLTPGTYTFTVTADVEDIETSTFDEGDYLSAALDSTRRALVVAENEQGDQLTDGTEMTGVASGTIQYFYSIAPTVTVVSSSITPNDGGTSTSVSATAKMKLAITANGGTLYLNGEDETTQAKEFFGIAIDGGDASSSISATGYTFTPSGTYTVTNSGSDNEYYTLNDGDTMYVDIEATIVEATGSSAILVGMKGDEILFGTADTSDTTRSANTLNFTALTDILKTGKVTLDS